MNQLIQGIEKGPEIPTALTTRTKPMRKNSQKNLSKVKSASKLIMNSTAMKHDDL